MCMHVHMYICVCAHVHVHVCAHMYVCVEARGQCQKSFYPYLLYFLRQSVTEAGDH